jgi:inosine/xanthosine triphosphate pyrophosphatase family protein/dephospho-CoA kinase
MISVPKRPTPREIFLTKDKQLQVFFYTSNIAKYLQAQLVFEKSGLILRHFRSRTEPYHEDYAGTKRELLARAVREILANVGASSIFFVEDTSLRIEAFSTPDRDTPGVAVKEWFASANFTAVDNLIKAKGNNRRVTVKSDVGLHIPGLGRPVFFEGATSGVIAETAPEFDENPNYPWLTPSTFNGWFIPEDAPKRLGEMSLEESWPLDFRIRSLEALVTRLEEYTGVLNLHSQAYSRKEHSDLFSQFPLFAGSILLIVGPTCAGKTTFGEHAQQKHDALHVEASSVLRMMRSGEGEEGGDAFTFATNFLRQNGPDIIARKILQLYSLRFDKGAVITGFRTIEELELIKDKYPGAKVVFVNASERTRFGRHLARGRTRDCGDIAEFRELDEEQASFGLLRVAEYLADIRIVNEGTLESYHRQVDSLMTSSQLSGVLGVSRSNDSFQAAEKTQLLRCLRVLDDAGRPQSCDEIEEWTARSGPRIRHNNANKVLKRVPELARRLESKDTRVRYEIQNAGRAYLRYFSRVSTNHNRSK